MRRRNFNAIYRYNASAIQAAGHRAARGHGGQQAIAAPWPTDDPGLSRAENKKLQILLLARGHDVGSVDGIIGEQTRQAIQVEQRKLGMKPDGRRAGQKLLRAPRQ